MPAAGVPGPSRVTAGASRATPKAPFGGTAPDAPRTPGWDRAEGAPPARDAGGLENARMLEDHIQLMFAVSQAGLGSFFYRVAEPGEL